MKDYKFIETVKVFLSAGRGGDGAISVHRRKGLPRGEPDGGNGGRGGDIILTADQALQSLTSLAFHQNQRAQPGGHGMGNKKNGRAAPPLVIKVPCGAEVFDESNGKLIADLVSQEESVVLARGGDGGIGNAHFKSLHTGEDFRARGQPGEARTIRLEFKMLSDAALLGFPNSGKSTLLRAITHAHPKIAQYPFTTRYPVLGTVNPETYARVTVVDIPALFKDAYQGKGLGNHFLRHAERTQCLVYVIDMAGTEDRTAEQDFHSLEAEVKEYDPSLLQKDSVIVANKMDLPGAAEHLEKFKTKTDIEVIPVSARTGKGVPALIRSLEHVL